MTRTARQTRKRHLEATAWEDLKSGNDEEKKVNSVKRPRRSSSINSLKNKRKLKVAVEKKIGHTGVLGNDEAIGEVTDLYTGVEDTLDFRSDNKELGLDKFAKKVCFNCRKYGHKLEDCPKHSHATGLCFKCGSTEHTVKKCTANLRKGHYPFAKCFVCGTSGHLSASCPNNPKGLYPNGGSCRVCGSVEHLKVNCPDNHKDKSDEMTLSRSSLSSSADADDNLKPQKQDPIPLSKKRVVKF